MKMTSYLYAVLDNRTGQYREFIVSPNAGTAARDILLTLRVPLKDTQLVCLGRFDSVFESNQELIKQSDISFTQINEVMEWSCYKFPENIADALAPLGCSPDEVREITLNHIKSIENNRSEVQDIINKSYKKE